MSDRRGVVDIGRPLSEEVNLLPCVVVVAGFF